MVAVHGHFGPGTTSAVRRYQARTGLRVSGVATPGTWHALRTGAPAQPRHHAKARHHAKDHSHGKAKPGRAHGKHHTKKSHPHKPGQPASKRHRG